jgi:hypothetical protein
MPSLHHPKPWHRGSVFGPGPRVPLDRERRARFRWLLDAHHRAGRLTRAARDVGEALLRRHGTDGRCDPAHATLAADAACCDRTVRRATAALRALGLLRWCNRLIRHAGTGWRAEQTSTAYELVPAVAPPPRPVFSRSRCGGQNGRGIHSSMIQVGEPSPADRAAAAAALANRRREMEQRLLTGRQAGRSEAA